MKPIASVGCSLMIFLALGCEPSTGSKLNQPIQAPPPQHPAMGSGVSAPGSSREAAANPHGGGLPAGHPPISTAPKAASSAAVISSEGGPVVVGPIAFDVPKGIVQESPENPMRLGQFRLPRAEGDGEDGLLTVSMAMGSVEANIERWRDQFEGKPEAKTAEKEVSGLKVSVVRIDGTFKGMGGPFAGGGAKAGYRMWGAVISNPQDPGQQIFFKGTGPKATMEKWDGAMEKLVASLKLAGE
ncbi:MAG: hypothetical protein HY717_15885 [Planctomycetes bacterium]|nr:hypothetical protein [Planctomycetota bacterium]